MKSTKKLKSKIKNRFRTYSNFAATVGIDRYELQKTFLSHDYVSDELFAKIDSLYDKHENKQTVLDGPGIDMIKKAIEMEGGMNSFCEKYGFKKRTLYAIFSHSLTYSEVANTKLVSRLIETVKTCSGKA